MTTTVTFLKQFYSTDQRHHLQDDGTLASWYQKTPEYQKLKPIIDKSNSDLACHHFNELINDLEQKIGKGRWIPTEHCPSLGASFQVELIKTDNLIVTRSLNVLVSYLLPRSFVFGSSWVVERECSILPDKEGVLNFLAYPHVIVTKGVGLFEKAFKYAEEVIPKYYPEHALMGWQEAMTLVPDRQISNEAGVKNRRLHQLLFGTGNYLDTRIIS